MVYGDLVNDPKERNKVLQEELGFKEEELTPRIVVTPIPFSHVFPHDLEDRIAALGIHYEWRHVTDPLLRPHHGNLLLEKDGKRGIVAFLGRGLIDFTERIRLISLTSVVKEVLFLGSAGSLDSAFRTGDLNIPRYVIPFENISTIYVDVTRAVPKADETLYKEVHNIAKKTGLRVLSRLHATVPLIYMETKEFLEYLRGVGISTIDMELSAFYRITRFHGKKAIAVLRTADIPLEGAHFFSEEYEKHEKERKEKALEAFLAISLQFLGLT